ncbi:hypothetical protein [Clavibacter michiganensis]|nr:hypothetical protein [Clavibacter michiganensis]MDO4138091.1 hypothetical protein [Clavibacter michiganensis]
MPTAATAAEVKTGLAPEVVASLQATWAENGVGTETQKALISKLDSGQLLDAMTGGTPVKTDISTMGTTEKQVQRFADGSINIVKIEGAVAPPKGQVSTQGVGGCTASGFRRDNCSIDGWFTGVRLGFNATFVYGTGTGRILAYSNPVVTCINGITCSDPVFSMVRKQQSGSLRADLGMYTLYSFIGVGGTNTTYLHLYVKDHSAYTN